MIRPGTIVLLLIALAAPACSRVQARTEPEPPPLEVPAPPPRVLAPLEAEQTPPAITPPAPANTATRPRPAARPETAKPEVSAAKPEPPRPDAATAKAPTSPEPAPGAVLQAAPPANEAELGRKVRQLISRASGDLNRVDYKRLNADAKSQYDTAKRFIEQANAALKERNVVFAEKLADKAAQMAAVLVGR